jgi:DNA phosphorothioation-associated putative methyltransferase
MVGPGRSVFDYGCGQGEDVAALAAQGIEAFGWDPHHAASGPRKEADTVNLGFVINVIEDPRERVETLKAAFAYARRAFCVAVMPLGKASTAGHRPYRDGFMTLRGTFQRYFDQSELRELVANATSQQPLSLAPGIVAVFRDKELEQEVLLRRRSRLLITGALPRPPARPPRVATVRPELRERIAPILERLRTIAFPLGRLPEADEIPIDLLTALERERVGWARAADMLRSDLETDGGFIQIGEERRGDLLVHLALMQFPGSPKYRALARSIQLDIKTFFRSHAAAQEEGRRLLFAAGDRAGIKADIEASIAQGLGAFRGSHTFRFRSTTLARLPGRLRVLVGCAEVLQGGIASCDFVDIDLEAPRVTMCTCDDIEQPIPFIVERLHVDLARLRVSVDKRERHSTPIYFKTRYLAPDDDLRIGQDEIDKALMRTGLFEIGFAEPSWDKVRVALSDQGQSIHEDKSLFPS